MKNTQEVIWDAITNSAKKRFDYKGFEAVFQDIGGKKMADKMLFMIIVGFVAGKSDELISAELIMQLQLLGCGLDEAFFAEFLRNRRDELKAEIRAMEYAHLMLELQNSPAEVMIQVNKMLNIRG